MVGLVDIILATVVGAWAYKERLREDRRLAHQNRYLSTHVSYSR